MTVDHWGLVSSGLIAVIVLIMIFLRSRIGLYCHMLAGLLFCLFSLVASIFVLSPDFGGSILLVIGLGLGVGIGAFVELTGRLRTENWFVLPPAFSAGGVLLLSVATVHSPEAMAPNASNSVLMAMISGVTASWAVGRAVANVLSFSRRFLPMSQTRPGLVLNVVVAATATCSSFYALLSCSGIAFLIACAAIFLFGLLLRGERGGRDGRQMLSLVGWAATATAFLGMATANVVLMMLGGFIAAALFGRFIPQAKRATF